MSFSTYIKTGTGVGLATGLVTSAYLAGVTDAMDRQSNPGTFGAMFLSAAAGLCGGPAGAVLGTSL